jgi:hypothetical protein
MPSRLAPSAYEHRQDSGFHRTAERSPVPVPVPVPRPLTDFLPWVDTRWEMAAEVSKSL